MPYDINSQQIDIENLFKQNANDLSSIKELYRKLKDLEEKITQIKYIDSKLTDKLKKDYEKLKRIILDENIQIELTNGINEINTSINKINNDINEVSSQLDNKANLNQFIEINAKYPPTPLVGITMDGETDDTNALNSIINFMSNNNIKTLIFPEGITKFNIEVNSSISIIGSGRGKTIFKAYKSDSPVLKYKGTDYSTGGSHLRFFELKDFTIQPDLATDGLVLNYCNSFTVDNIMIYRALNRDGLYLKTCFDSSFKDIHIGECGSIDKQYSAIKIENSTTHSCNRLKFYNVHIENNKHNLIVDGSYSGEPNNNIVFYSLHIEGKKNSDGSKSQNGILVKGENNNFILNHADFTYFNNAIEFFDENVKGYYKFDSIQFFGCSNEYILDGMETGTLRIYNNDFLMASSTQITLKDNFNKSNLILRENYGSLNNEGGYKVNNVAVYDNGKNQSGVFSPNNEINKMYFKNRQGKTLLKLNEIGGIVATDNRQITINSMEEFVYTLGSEDNPNGRCIIFLVGKNYGNLYAIAYFNGSDIYPISVGSGFTCATTNEDTTNRINVYVKSNAKLGIKNNFGDIKNLNLFILA